MKKISQPIIFFGTEEFSATILLDLIEADYNVRAVVTKQDSRKGRGQHLIEPSVKTVARQYDIPVWQPLKLHDISENINNLNSDTVGILASYGKIIPQSIINAFTPGIINVHPSLLPKYRGPTPIESAIKNGDKETGVSIMQLTAEMDAGPVYAKEKYPLKGNETRPELYNLLSGIGSKLLLRALPAIITGSLKPTEQDDSQATYCHLLQKKDSWLDTKSVSAQEVERLIRAHLGFPKTKIALNSHSIIITKAHTTSVQKTPLDFICRDGAYISVDELIAPSGKHMDAGAFLRGYRFN